MFHLISLPSSPSSFVPVKVDYTDLYDIMAFFSGDLNHEHGHEELAKRIAQQGKEFANKYWRWEDLEAYTFRLYLEWARVSGEHSVISPVHVRWQR